MKISGQLGHEKGGRKERKETGSRFITQEVVGPVSRWAGYHFLILIQAHSGVNGDMRDGGTMFGMCKRKEHEVAFLEYLFNLFTTLEGRD